jgi:DNA-directed RNA polymerase specialized sigma24 family protein
MPEHPEYAGAAFADPDAPDPVERAIAREAIQAAVELLGELADEQRAALCLSAAGFGTAESARALGLSQRAYRKRIEHGNRRLREIRSTRSNAQATPMPSSSPDLAGASFAGAAAGRQRTRGGAR